jgi:general secretion pathway protein D
MTQKFKMMRGMILLSIVVAVLVSACSPSTLQVPVPRVAIPSSGEVESLAAGPIATALPDSTADSSPIADGKFTSIDPLRSEPMVSATPSKLARFKDDDAISVAVDGMPLRNFLNYALGDLLKVSFIVAEAAGALDQPVTLNTQKPVSSRQLYRLILETLATKGLTISESEGVYLVGPSSGQAGGGATIGFGRNASDVPDVPGNILQIVPLRYGPNISMETLVREITGIQGQPDVERNALFLRGQREGIVKAIELIQMLDQPLARGSRIGLLSLTYTDARAFIEQLVVLLANEGITAGAGRAEGRSVALVPLDRLGLVVAFAGNPALLERVEFWAKLVDRPSSGPTERYFFFQPRYSRAADLAESVAPLIGGAAQAAAPAPVGNTSRDTRSAMGGEAGSQQGQGMTVVKGDGVTISVDSRSNSLVFFTSGARYEALLPLLRRFDVPPKQILLEATIAEVTLSGEFANGVEFVFADKKLSGGTGGGLGLPSGGLALSYLANATDSIRLRLQSGDTRINVLSNPILVVRDGVPASIMVGNEVPTVGSSVTNPLQSDRTVTTVSYRSTGIRLNITPTINAQGSVLMSIQQDISNAVPGSSGVDGAPIFFRRGVETEVVARSGQSILLAGLISESSSTSSTGVPVLARIPGLGAAFRSDSKKREKTELVLLITPRIIETADQWEGVRRDFQQALDYVELVPPKTATTPDK